MRGWARVAGALAAGVVGAAFVGAAFAGCGARSQLQGGEPCDDEGATRDCRDLCGAGTATCREGIWSRCEVAPVVEACDGICGRGERTCIDRAWSECRVEPQVVACENDCGVGEQLCEDGVLHPCVVGPTERECRSVCGTGVERCEEGEWGPCDAPRPLPPTLTAVVRDFRDSHPDFERTEALASLELGIVAPRLGEDGKPVYVGGEGRTTTGRESFDQWYRDVPGVNATTTLELPLRVSAQDSRLWAYEDRDFFPIDGQLFGNEGREHNFHFTLEAAAEFEYVGGEIFRFTGDDDVWVFVNGGLVIDLGGLHQSLSAEVALDEVAEELGLALGGVYPLHIFFAERKTVASNFVIETSIAAQAECPVR